MQQNRRRLFALVPVAALALAACSDSIGPNGNVEPLDPVTANQQAQSITESLEGNPGLASLELLETTTPFLAGSGAEVLLQAASPFSPESDGQGLRFRMERLQAAAGPYLSSAEPAVILPADLVGKWMIIDPTTGEYVVDETRSGPDNGVRFSLYAIDPVFENPILDQEIGTADFLDESSPTEDALRIVVLLFSVSDTDPVIVVFRAVGFVHDGSRTLDFDLEQRISQEERVELDYSLTARDNGITITFTAVAPGAEGVGVDFALTVSNGSGEALALTLNVSEAGISGRLSLPGDASDIIITAHGEEWTIEHENPDEPITDREEQAIRNMFHLLERIEHVVHKLLRPAHRILNVPVFLLR
jgi:hypothetical protein